MTYHFSRSSIKFQVTRDKKSQILTRIERFRTVTPVLIHPGVWEDAQSFMKNRQLESNLSKITRPVAAIKSLRFALLLQDRICYCIGLVFRGNKPSLNTMLTKINDHMMSQGHSELNQSLRVK